MIARRFIVSGRVQGVCFRDWTVQAAQAAGVAGWVRNRRDGTVEVHAEGEAAAVESLVRACHDGPPAARVDRVAACEVAPEGMAGFERRWTG
jgi:acylphosphatase